MHAVLCCTEKEAKKEREREILLVAGIITNQKRESAYLKKVLQGVPLHGKNGFLKILA